MRLSIYRGLYGLLNDELARGANQLLAAFGIGCALAGGVTLGEWFDRTVRRPPILRKFGALRRPVVQRIRRPAVNLGKRRATPPVRHPVRVPVQHSTPADPQAPLDSPIGFPAVGQLPQLPEPAGRGRAPVPEFDHGVWTRNLDATPLGPPTALPDATPAALPTETLEMPALPAELPTGPAEPLGVAEDIRPTEAMPILAPMGPAGCGPGEPVGIGAAEPRLAPTEPLTVAPGPDGR